MRIWTFNLHSWFLLITWNFSLIAKCSCATFWFCVIHYWNLPIYYFWSININALIKDVKYFLEKLMYHCMLMKKVMFYIDWQDSRISRGNGKWICGKIPAGNGLREIAGKMSKIWPNFWLKLTQTWSKTEFFQDAILCTNETNQCLYGTGYWSPFSTLSQISLTY